MFRKTTHLAAATLLLAACATSSPSPTPSGSETSASPSPTAETFPAVMYFVADTQPGLRLYTEVHNLPVAEDRALAAIQALVSNSSPAIDPDYVNLWALKPNRVLSLTRDGGSATVDLDLQGLNVGAEGEARAIDQILWTLTAADSTISRMQLLVNGEEVETIAGHVDATGWFKRGEPYEVMATVTVDAPASLSTVKSPVVATGMACTFEANVVWALYQDNKKIKGGSTIAGEACPVRSPWRVELGSLKPGIYTFRAYDLSAKDGSLVSQDTKTFTVS